MYYTHSVMKSCRFRLNLREQSDFLWWYMRRIFFDWNRDFRGECKGLGAVLNALSVLCTCIIAFCLLTCSARCQSVPPDLKTPKLATLQTQMVGETGLATTGSESESAQAITLSDAINRATRNEPTFAAAAAASKVAALDKSIARSTLLPNVVYHNQYLYTEGATGATGSANASAGAGTTSGTPRFIANNSVHEYMSQGEVNETVGLQHFNALARATALQAAAAAELEIARRGLVATVTALYYQSLAADRKVVVAERAAVEAADLTGITTKREDAREVAHADVIKAQLQQQQRDRDLANAKLDSERSRLELAVLLFPDPHSAFTLSSASIPASLATREEIMEAAAANNAELKSAMASLHAASLDVKGARAAYLPDLALNFTYGIDAAQLAVHSPDGTRNLGYSASATLDIPVWDWFATHDRIKQKTALREAANVALTSTQRRLIAQIDEYYNEAKVARDQIDSLAVSVQTAREGLRLSRVRYTAGEANVLEVVDAQSSLATAENANEDGVVRYQVALANLHLLTGQKIDGAN
jgi:outer membrane protein